MAISIALEVLIPVVIILVVIWGVLALLTRGKMLKCPDCGTVFASPAMDQKRSGLGWTFPYTGTVKCPKCGESRPRRDYQKAPVVQRPTQ
jgi:uncharacterized C2H2 Zn-finger protein